MLAGHTVPPPAPRGVRRAPTSSTPAPAKTLDYRTPAEALNEVLSPASVRTRLIDTARQILTRYDHVG